MAVSLAATDIITSILFSLIFVFNMITSIDLLRKIHLIKRTSMKICIVFYTSSLVIGEISYVVYHSVEYNASSSLEYTLMAATFSTYVITCCISYLSIAYFYRLKLKNVYKNSIFVINSTFINVLFLIYFISTIFIMVTLSIVWGLSSVTNSLSAQKTLEIFSTMLLYSQSEFAAMDFAYQILVLILFNFKLFKFIKLTISNDKDETLSYQTYEENTFVTKKIIKQTSLISIIITSSLVFQICANVRWSVWPKHPNMILIYNLSYFLWALCSSTCIYLTFKFNDNYYQTFCNWLSQSCTNALTAINSSSKQQLNSY
eukprot:170327_1